MLFFAKSLRLGAALSQEAAIKVGVPQNDSFGTIALLFT